MDGLRPKSGKFLVQNVLKHLLTEDLMEDQKVKKGLTECMNLPRETRWKSVIKEEYVIVVYVVVKATTLGNALDSSWSTFS